MAFCRFCGAPLADDARPAAKPPATDAHTPPPLSAAQPVALILSVGQDGKASATFELTERLDFGRAEGDVVITWDPYVSPRHLRVEVREGAVYARDLGSVNGTYLRIRPGAARGVTAGAPTVGGSGAENDGTGEVILQDQDLILLGQQVIRFEVVKDAEAGFGPATQHGTALFGTPAGPVYARLCQRTVEGVTRDVFHVRKDEVVMGRELGDVVFTDDAFLSRRHAVLRRNSTTGAFALADAGSSNGTFVRVRGEVRLQGGDEIRIGQQLFRIELPPAPRAPAPLASPTTPVTSS